jgi:hypothetical protein
LVELLDSENEMARLGAAKEIIGRVAPPPPRRKAEGTTVNVAINNQSADGRAIAVARARLRANGLNPNDYFGPGTLTALPGPTIDVACEAVEADPIAEDEDDGSPI